jgi:hypothetical protein
MLKYVLYEWSLLNLISWLVLAPGAGNLPVFQVLDRSSVQVSFRTGQKLNQPSLGGVVTLTGHKLAVCLPRWNLTVVPYYGSYHFCSSLAPNKFLCSNEIMTWLVCRLCSFSSSFTSRIQNCDATNIGWVAMKYHQLCTEITGFSTATQRILVALQFWNREVQARLIIHNHCTDHVTIRSELRY